MEALLWTGMQMHKRHLVRLHSLPNNIKALKRSPVLLWTLKTTLLTTWTCRKVRLNVLLKVLDCAAWHQALVALAKVATCR